MKSFRFSYILAMLLAGGATTALTGCIDTTEPAGITELRGAKALLLKAKAAYVDAKTQRQNVYMEQDKVQLEQDKINLEISKLNLELQKALNDLKLDSTNAAKQLVLEKIQKERDALALQAEQQWWETKQAITSAETAYKRAVIDLQVALLTYKDQAISEPMQKYAEQLYGEEWKNMDVSQNIQNPNVLTGGLYGLLNAANTELMNAQREKVLFTARSENYLNTLNTQKVQAENVLNIQKKLLEDLQALSDSYSEDNLENLSVRLNEVQKKIDELEPQKENLYNEIQNMKQTTLAGISKKMADYEEILDADTTIVIDIVDKKLQNDLGNRYQSDPSYNKCFELNADGKYEMVAPIEIKKKLRSQKNNFDLANIQSSVQDIFQGQYVAAYNSYTGEHRDATQLFETDGITVKPAYVTKLEHEIERLELDKENVRKVYENAADKWLKTYEVLDKALTAYEGYKDPSASYEAADKAVEEYLTATQNLSTLDADEKAEFLKLSQNLRTELNKYYTLRAPIDSVSAAYLNFKKNFIDLDADKKDQLTDQTLNAFRTAVSATAYDESTYYSILGKKDFKNYDYGNNDKGALPEFLAAERDLFGTGNYSLAKALQPIKTDNGYVAPDGLTAESYDYSLDYWGGVSNQKYSEIGTNSKFMKAALTYNQPAIRTTLADWVKLYETIGGQIAEVNEKVDALVDAKNALINNNKEAFEAVWKKEIECYLIDANPYMTNEDGYDDYTKPVFSDENPYYKYYIQKEENGNADPDTGYEYVTPPATSELSALRAELQVLQDLIDNQGKQISFVTYTDDNGYVVISKTYEGFLKAQEAAVRDAQENLDNIQVRIDLLNEVGYIDDSTTGSLNIPESAETQYMELLDKKIKDAQNKVDLLQAEFDKVQAKIQSLIEAVEKEDFGSSDATYPGFEVDNNTSTDTPSTDTPSTDTPSGDATDQEQPATEEPAE